MLAELSLEHRILFAGLWCLADREGRLEDRPKRIKSEVFPYDNIDANPMLDALAESGFIVRYAVEDAHYIEIKHFGKHQRPHTSERPSVIPQFGEPRLTTAANLDEPPRHTKVNHTSTPKSESNALTPDSPTPDSGFSDSPTAGKEPRQPSLIAPAEPAAPKSKRKPLKFWPEAFALTEKLKQYAIAKGVPADKVESEWEAFHAWCIREDAMYRNWDAAWCTRVLNYGKFGGKEQRNGLASQNSRAREESIAAARKYDN